MREKLIIDGYNLIHAIPGMLDSSRDNLEKSREKLLDMIVAFSERRNLDIIVVFDGIQDDVISLEAPISQNVQVRFSPPHKKADTIIIELIQAQNNPKACSVVSSDKAVARGIKYWGSKSITSQEFIKILHQKKGRSNPPEEKKPEMKPVDMEVWRRIFKK